jgi:hypothetical protein
MAPSSALPSPRKRGKLSERGSPTATFRSRGDPPCNGETGRERLLVSCEAGPSQGKIHTGTDCHPQAPAFRGLAVSPEAFIWETAHPALEEVRCREAYCGLTEDIRGRGELIRISAVTQNRPTKTSSETLTPAREFVPSVGMANVLSDEKKRQVIALGRPGWTLRRIQQVTAVRREAASSHLKAAGVAVRSPGGWGRRATSKTGLSPRRRRGRFKTGHRGDRRLWRGKAGLGRVLLPSSASIRQRLYPPRRRRRFCGDSGRRATRVVVLFRRLFRASRRPC